LSATEKISMAAAVSFMASKSHPTLLHSNATLMAAVNAAAVDEDEDDDNDDDNENKEVVRVVEPMLRGSG
jgi:hypothetical protein